MGAGGAHHASEGEFFVATTSAVVREPGPVNGIPFEKVPAAMVPDGMPFPSSVDGAVSAGNGKVRVTQEASEAALRRAVRALGHANTAGLPVLDPAGDLPSGIHAATHGEFMTRFGGTPRRQALLAELRNALGTLRSEGVEAVVVGGSFVTGKPGPGDIDVAWVRNARTSESAVGRAMSKIAREVPGISAYPADDVVVNAPILKGATPGESFLEMFQHDRTGARRGAVLLSTVDEGADAAGIVHSLRQEVADHAMRGLRALSTIR